MNDRLKSVSVGIPLLTGRVPLTDSQQLRESEMGRLHSELLDVRTRLEAQKQALQLAADEVSGVYKKTS